MLFLQQFLKFQTKPQATQLQASSRLCDYLPRNKNTQASVMWAVIPALLQMTQEECRNNSPHYTMTH